MSDCLSAERIAAKSGLRNSRHSVTMASASQPSSAAIAESAKLVEGALDGMLPRPEGRQARVQEAMRYAIQAGGKRLRPFLVLQSARLFGVPDARALRVGAAIESLNTYSLVHDDLPCMDDDDLRRGRPTTHIAFDEMTAHCRDAGLMIQKIPEQLVVIDALPRNPTLNKVLKQQLRDELAGKDWSPPSG